MPDPPSHAVYLVSDGTCRTCEQLVRAVLVQFEHAAVQLVRKPDIRRADAVARLIGEAADAGAIVFYTLVTDEARDAMRAAAQQHMVPVVDLLGPLIMKVAQRLHVEPRHQPGLLHGFSDDYFDRVEAVEFAVRHDDGANLATLHEADIVLTGVSRTSKTPLSIYLAQRGYKTGNVPLVPGMDAPKELLELNPRRVFGLTVDPGTLLSVRTARLRSIKASSSTTYTDPDEVMLELARARKLCRTKGWLIIDVSGRAVEENASRLIEAYELFIEGQSE